MPIHYDPNSMQRNNSLKTQGGNIVNPTLQTEVPKKQSIEEVQMRLKEAYIELNRITGSSLSTNERYLFARCKDVLLGAANNKIPTDRNQLKRQLQILRSVRDLLKKGRPIPQDIVQLYRSRHKDIQANIKAHVARRSESYARKIKFSSDPKKGLREICDMARLALIWNV